MRWIINLKNEIKNCTHSIYGYSGCEGGDSFGHNWVACLSRSDQIVDVGFLFSFYRLPRQMQTIKKLSKVWKKKIK